MWGTQAWYTVTFLPSKALWERLALDLMCGSVLLCSPWYTRAGMKEVPGLCLVCPFPWSGKAAWRGDSPDLIQPKLTLFSSGLLGLPEWELLRPNNPFWGPGTFLPFQTENPLVCESPCKGTVPPPPGSQIRFERSVVHFALSSSILGRMSLGGSQAPLGLRTSGQEFLTDGHRCSPALVLQQNG